MARDQLAVGSDKAGDGPAELCHAGGDFCHLIGVMGLCIPGVGPETGEGPMLDPAGQ
ncbi:hypothetical protein GCM10007291_40260 [Gemmobacter nanjingensis]|uniref:Uncharacterized protein n=1 Tax=Gemmobacter nanjingensis TaxID=488454 RepID=A0ABQ3FQZ9_9RHOB|nr:hypothetical protein GCM10007291_40260 [Gemmobacter nanjingensis]